MYKEVNPSALATGSAARAQQGVTGDGRLQGAERLADQLCEPRPAALGDPAFEGDAEDRHRDLAEDARPGLARAALAQRLRDARGHRRELVQLALLQLRAARDDALALAREAPATALLEHRARRFDAGDGEPGA